MPFKITQIVETVQKRTQNVANSKLDLRLEFWLALQEFCADQHFWWRQKSTSFPTVIGTAEYDLTLLNGKDYEESIGVFRMTADGLSVEAELNEVYDASAQIASLVATAAAPPGMYFIKPGTTQVIHLGAPADSVRTLFVQYWATPNPDDPSDAQIDDIPLVPMGLHYGLVVALERRVFRFLYGQNDPRFVTANAAYVEFLSAASRKNHWSGNKAVTASSGRPGIQAH